MERVSLFVTDPPSIHSDSSTLPYLRLGQPPIYIAINSEPIIHLQKKTSLKIPTFLEVLCRILFTHVSPLAITLNTFFFFLNTRYCILYQGPLKQNQNYLNFSCIKYEWIFFNTFYCNVWNDGVSWVLLFVCKLLSVLDPEVVPDVL